MLTNISCISQRLFDRALPYLVTVGICGELLSPFNPDLLHYFAVVDDFGTLVIVKESR